MICALVTEEGTLEYCDGGNTVERPVGFQPNTVIALEPCDDGYRIKGVVGVQATSEERRAGLRLKWRAAMEQKYERLLKKTHWFEKLKLLQKGEQVMSYQPSTIRQRASEVETEIIAYNELAEEYALPLLMVELPTWT